MIHDNQSQQDKQPPRNSPNSSLKPAKKKATSGAYTPKADALCAQETTNVRSLISCNQWPEINDPRSLDGIRALEALAAYAKPLCPILTGQVESKAAFVLTTHTQVTTVEGVIDEFKTIAPDLCQEVIRFYLEQNLADSEWITIKEIIRIFMASNVGQNFYIPRQNLCACQYKEAHITRLSGTSPHGL